MPDGHRDPAASRLMVQKLLEPPKLAIDRMPGLHGVFERLASTCAERFRQYCAAPTTIFVNQVKTGNSWDILESYEDGMGGIYYVPEWDANVLIGVDRKFVFSLIEAAYGADGTEAPFSSDRLFSSFEARFAKEIIAIAAETLAACFEPAANVTLKPQRLETKIEFTVMGPNDMPVVAAQLVFQVMDMGGRMFILIPQSAIYPLRKKLERETQAVSLPNDPRWTRQMQQGVASTDVRLQAILEKQAMTLAEISQFQPGQLLQLRTHAHDLIALESGAESLFRCKLAQANGNFSVVIETPVSSRDEFIGEILGNVQPKP